MLWNLNTIIGNRGVIDSVIDSINTSLTAHELIKIRFNERKKEKKELTAQIAEATESEIAGIIGHVAILYRQHPKESLRKIKLKSS